MPDISVKDLIRQEAQKQGVPVSLALAIAEHESGPDYNPLAKGPEIKPGVYAYGTMQLMPETAKLLGVNREDPTQNIQGGVKYLRQLLDQYQGDLTKVLSAYGGDSTGTGQRYGMDHVLQLRAKYADEDTRVAQRGAEQAKADASRADPFAGSGKGTKLTGPPTVGERLRQGGRAIVEDLPMIGAALGTAASVATVPVTGGVSLLAPLFGAYLGGSAGAATREAIQRPGLVDRPSGEPARTTPVGTTMHEAGTEQTLYEAGGQAIARPIQWLIRRFVAPQVARRASEGIKAEEQAFHEGLAQDLDRAASAVERRRRGLSIARREMGGRVRALEEGGRQAKETAARFGQIAKEARASVPSRKIEGDLERAVASGRWPTAAPPPAPAVGRQVAGVIQGPAKDHLNELGQIVEQAAQEGPLLDLSPVKARAQAIAERELKPVAEHFTPTPESPDAAQLSGLGQESLGASPEQALRVREALKAQGVDLGEDPEAVIHHPAMKVIQKFFDAHPEGEVPFAAAHQFKRDLDEAVNWESPARKKVQQITKALRQELRNVMGKASADYNVATEAYASAVKLHSKGIAPRLVKNAIDNPESLLTLVKGQQPTRLKMLRDVLLTQAADSPDPNGAAQGRAAWNNLREAWTHKHLIAPGIEKFDQNLAKLDPEFLTTLYGDQEGQQVLGNLQTISGALKQANDRMAQDLGALRQTARLAQGQATAASAQASQAGTDAARLRALDQTARARGDVALTEHRVALAQTRRDVAERKATGLPQSRAFLESSLIRVGSPAQVGTDVAHAATGIASGDVRSYWVLASTFRLLTRGAKVSDLVRFAAYSPHWTQAIVKASTSSTPGVALADVYRAMQMYQDMQAREEAAPVSSHSGPPPAPKTTR